MTITIDALKKVELSLVLAGEYGDQSVADSSVGFEFIFGIATDGLCPFELALMGRKEGENCILNVSAAEANEYFGHHFPLLKQLLSLQMILPETIHLNIHIVSIQEAESKEIVQSIARAAASCSCGGSCGCG